MIQPQLRDSNLGCAMRSYHPPDDAHMLAILEPAYIGFVGDTVRITETRSGQAGQLIMMAFAADRLPALRLFSS
jgi:hypothetical protein